MEPHDEFLELCAVSTSGELSEQERRTLQAHLAGCAECRRALREFEAAVDVGVPFLASKLSAELSAVSTAQFRSHQAKLEPFASLGPAAASQRETNDASAAGSAVQRGFAFGQGNGQGRTKVNWNYVWLPFAACVLLTITLGIFAYRMGRSRSVEVTQKTSPAPDVQIEALEQQMSDAGHEHEGLRLQLAQRDKVISDLKREMQTQSASLDAMKSAQANLEKSILNDESRKQQGAQERGTLLQQLGVAQASLEKTQTQLTFLQQQRAQDQSRAESLEAQVNDLHAQLRDRELAMGKQEELLAHDRDVRELLGARDLYIAEIYNVARDGVTQKPYGRVFYTKGKSLIFYAYDLDEEPGVRTASTFQAWGKLGPDRRQALSLGIFYEDNAAKKRWVLKFDDAKTLEQIDAVFVTVEPAGGSSKPSGSPLLFTYLKIGPNHP
jgi:Anti-sigma-K factor rskA/Putative zinc-finger